MSSVITIVQIDVSIFVRTMKFLNFTMWLVYSVSFSVFSRNIDYIELDGINPDCRDTTHKWKAYDEPLQKMTLAE